VVSRELRNRTSGTVVPLDLRPPPRAEASSGITPVTARAQQLPLLDASFDLVFSQFAFLWFHDIETVAAEVYRVLRPGGVLALLEPDYGGLIEYPDEVALEKVWISALQRAGADPYVARRLPSALHNVGFVTHVMLLDQLKPPSPQRFEFLLELPLTAAEASQVHQAQVSSESLGQNAIAHLPIFLISAEKPPTG
jgi:SAM-dependent methyltransferase